MVNVTFQPRRHSPTQQLISQELRRRLGREWLVGERLPPIKELARQLGAGLNNTHEAVRELAREGLLRSRQRQGTFVVRESTRPVVPSAGTSTLGSLTARTIDLYATGLPEGLIRRMIDTFSAAIAPTGAHIALRSLAYSGEFLPSEPDPAADAVVLFNPSSDPPIRCHPHQLLTVVTTTMYRQIAMPSRYDVVSVDEHHGGLLAGKALRDAGCRDACFVGCRLQSDEKRYEPTSSVRLMGFEAGWGQPLPARNLLYVNAYGLGPGAMALRQYLELNPRPKGIFAASDDLAVGFVTAAISHGLTAGRDFQLVGFDGQHRGQHMGDASLTTVKVPAEEMGRRAAQLLIERFNQPARPVLRIQLDCAIHHGTTTHRETPS